ncbi:hypothetical protein, partial [Vibrio anguillarum]|uniref:hypothetical protein n=1 Tax=Vibrio anguillarum TaxID=55601 RepID=UPI001BE45439
HYVIICFHLYYLRLHTELLGQIIEHSSIVLHRLVVLEIPHPHHQIEYAVLAYQKILPVLYRQAY